MKGEAIASQCEHADNLAPAIYGGFVLVKSIHPLEIIQLPTPDDLYVTVIHPQIEIKTAEARAILPKEIPLQKAITQWANLGSLVHALHTNDYDLISKSLHDEVIEPYRSQLIPHFDKVKNAALNAGALGCSISGSGPSIFSLSKGIETAKNVKDAINNIYKTTGIDFDMFVCKINTQGIKIISK